ncbi:HAMP domain-containing sensor histidine kinase [Bacillus massiliigorillae]|uniref:HAMP domain-containing sensor histidine kinase n=1 Tax=Bacillus massiliigorillae TaxID=1243664 RepID=UPI0003A56957|nr:HAMP domain-containing sensor histidine kinase [Bacillus massiliigorillae]
MKNISIVWKLSIFTFAVFFFFYGLLLIGQATFFERFYLYQKASKLEKKLEDTKQQIIKNPQDEEKMSRMAGEFMEENDATFTIASDVFGRYALNPYRITMKTKNGIKNIILSKEGMRLNQIPSTLKVGDQVVVDGFYIDTKNRSMEPVQVQLTERIVKELPVGLTRIEGTVISLTLPKQRAYNAFYQDSLNSTILHEIAMNKKYTKSLNQGKKVQLEWQDVVSGIKYAVIMLPLSLPKDMPQYVMAYTSLQPVDEAMETMKQYYGYIAGAGVLLLLVLSYVYSKMVASPLVSLNQGAKRLAKLDFTVKLSKRNRDEIGELADSLEQMSSHLQETIQQLTLANIQLQDELSKKQQREQIRKEFTANVSHELKTPLGIIRGFTEGLQDDIAQNKRERYLDLILNEVERMDGMVLDLLQLSKYEANVMSLRQSVFSLHDIIESVIEQFNQQLEEKQLAIQYEPIANDLVHADEKKISQVFINMISNAIRHAEMGTAVTIYLIEHKKKIEVQVENKGELIPENQLDRVWAQFYRLDASRDRKLGGTGLGLAIVKQILQLHNSEYAVRNGENSVIFSFDLEKSN